MSNGAAVFDAAFYGQVLPDRVVQECRRRPGDIPAVELHLVTGRVFDLCHIAHLGETWFALQYYRDARTCDDMDLAFLPYGLVALVTVSLHNPSSRKLGFAIERQVASPQPAQQEARR